MMKTSPEAHEIIVTLLATMSMNARKQEKKDSFLVFVRKKAYLKSLLLEMEKRENSTLE